MGAKNKLKSHLKYPGFFQVTSGQIPYRLSAPPLLCSLSQQGSREFSETSLLFKRPQKKIYEMLTRSVWWGDAVAQEGRKVAHWSHVWRLDPEPPFCPHVEVSFGKPLNPWLLQFWAKNKPVCLLLPVPSLKGSVRMGTQSQSQMEHADHNNQIPSQRDLAQVCQRDRMIYWGRWSTVATPNQWS